MTHAANKRSRRLLDRLGWVHAAAEFVRHDAPQVLNHAPLDRFVASATDGSDRR